MNAKLPFMVPGRVAGGDVCAAPTVGLSASLFDSPTQSGLADPFGGTEALRYVDASAAAYTTSSYMDSAAGEVDTIPAAGGTVDYWIRATGMGPGFLEMQNLIGGSVCHWQFDHTTGAAGIRVSAYAGASLSAEALGCAPGWHRVRLTIPSPGVVTRFRSRVLIAGSHTFLGANTVSALGEVTLYGRLRVLPL